LLVIFESAGGVRPILEAPAGWMGVFLEPMVGKFSINYKSID